MPIDLIIHLKKHKRIKKHKTVKKAEKYIHLFVHQPYL